MDSLSLKLNLKPQTNRIFAKDLSPGNLIVFETSIVIVLSVVKIKLECFVRYQIIFLTKDCKTCKYTSVGTTIYDIL